MMRGDIVTVFVAISLAVVLAVVAYVRISRPRHEAWQPEELSRLPCSVRFSDDARACRLAWLAPPFPSPTNGVRKC